MLSFCLSNSSNVSCIFFLSFSSSITVVTAVWAWACGLESKTPFVIIVHLWTFASATFSVCVHSRPRHSCLLVKRSLYPRRSEGFPRTRKTKSSCACDCGRGPVSVGAFLLSSFFFSHPESCLKNEIFAGKSDV